MDTIVKKIIELKKQRNAIILAHNYQPEEIQDIADFLGDSLDLSRKAARISEDVIVFCGVHFMAETAAILAPGKTVLLPAPDAGCPMADMATADSLRTLKAQHPGAVVVTYVNSTAEVKAESDICCTSANAVQVVKSLGEKEIIFVPDRNLGAYVEAQTGKKMILWNGYCPTHARILPEHVRQAKTEHPNAKVLVHPECNPDVIALADKVLSTTGMIKFAHIDIADEFIIATESGILYRMKKENPAKRFYEASANMLCPNMKKNTLEKVLTTLQTMKNRIVVEEPTRSNAMLAIERMLAIPNPLTLFLC